MTPPLGIENLSDDVHAYLLHFLSDCVNYDPSNILSLCTASPVIYRVCKYYPKLLQRIDRLITKRLKPIARNAIIQRTTSTSSPKTTNHIRTKQDEITTILRQALFKHRVTTESELSLIADILALFFQDPEREIGAQLGVWSHTWLRRLQLRGVVVVGHPVQIARLMDVVLCDLVGLVPGQSTDPYCPTYALGESYRQRWVERGGEGI